MLAQSYITEDRQEGPLTNFAHIVVDEGSDAVYISRHFVDRTARADYEDIGLNAIRHFQHRGMDRARVVTGLTYLRKPRVVRGETGASWAPCGRTHHTDGAPLVVIPHIFQCVDLAPTDVPLRLANSKGYDFADPNGALSTGVYEVDCDLEEIEFVRYMTRCRVPDEEAAAAIARALPSNARAYFAGDDGQQRHVYPEQILEDYAQRTARNIELMKGDTATTASALPFRNTLAPGSARFFDLIQEAKRMRAV